MRRGSSRRGPSRRSSLLLATVHLGPPLGIRGKVGNRSTPSFARASVDAEDNPAYPGDMAAQVARNLTNHFEGGRPRAVGRGAPELLHDDGRGAYRRGVRALASRAGGGRLQARQHTAERDAPGLPPAHGRNGGHRGGVGGTIVQTKGDLFTIPAGLSA